MKQIMENDILGGIVTGIAVTMVFRLLGWM